MNCLKIQNGITHDATGTGGCFRVLVNQTQGIISVLMPYGGKMTKELAIRILAGDVLGTSEQTHEAVKMAVKALSLPDVPDMSETQSADRRRLT